MSEWNHFTVIVAGDNHAELMAKFDKNNKCEPYIAYEVKKAGEYRQKYLKIYEELSKRTDISEELIERYKEIIEEIKNTDDLEFYIDLTSQYDLDDDGNAITTENKEGKYSQCALGGRFAIPFKNLEGFETYSEKKGNIAWDEIHLVNQDVYRIAWEMVMEDRKPENDEEKEIYENMKNRKVYFEHFGDKETYIASNTAFWGYAFLSEDGKWTSIDDGYEQNDWCCNFYDRFIVPLSDDTRLTIYECNR